MKKIALILFVAVMAAACNSPKEDNDIASTEEISTISVIDAPIDSASLVDTEKLLPMDPDSVVSSFWGKEVFVLISKDRPQGYEISIFKSDDLCIWHFKKGDDVNHYIATHQIPRDLENELYKYLEENNYPHNADIKMVFYTNFSEHIPVRDQLDMGFSFVDVDFDGENEFVVEHNAYHLHNYYYACFDLDDGSKAVFPGFLAPMYDDPYGNLKEGTRGRTTLDHKKKEIRIASKIGNADIIETFAKKIDGEVKVVESIEYVNYINEKSKTTYKLVNDTLKKVGYQTFKDETFFKKLCEKYQFD